MTKVPHFLEIARTYLAGEAQVLTELEVMRLAAEQIKRLPSVATEYSALSSCNPSASRHLLSVDLWPKALQKEVLATIERVTREAEQWLKITRLCIAKELTQSAAEYVREHDPVPLSVIWPEPHYDGGETLQFRSSAELELPTEHILSDAIDITTAPTEVRICTGGVPQ